MDGGSDILVLGAGMAGLTAAQDLAAAGLTVSLLEARDRLGGRIHTLHDPQWPVPIECGAEFIHGRPRETWDLLRRWGLVAYDVAQTPWVKNGRKALHQEDLWSEVEAVLGRLPRRGPDLSFEAFLHEFGADFSPAVRQRARLYVEGFNAADAREISAQALAAQEVAAEEIQGDRLFRLQAGYDALVEHAFWQFEPSQVALYLQAPAALIRWRRGGVEVRTEGPVPRVYRARAAVISVPLSTLLPVRISPHHRPHPIRFEPALPKEKLEALSHLRMGPVIKIVFHFSEPFWEIPGREEMAFLHVTGAPFPTWWTTLPLRTSVLTAWCGGRAAAELSGRSDRALLDLALGGLAEALDVPRRRVGRSLLGAHVCNWQADGLAGGAYSYVAVGGVAAPAALGRPVEGTLFFAGEATHAGLSGTVAGAIASGHRAAREAVAALGGRGRGQALPAAENRREKESG